MADELKAGDIAYLKAAKVINSTPTFTIERVYSHPTITPIIQMARVVWYEHTTHELKHDELYLDALTALK
jgi:hypothetical protein